jgi:hypothetical protein
MKITENKLRWFVELGEQITEFADMYARARYNETGALYISDFYSSNSISFRLEWETGCMGCYDKHDMDFDIPFHYFTEDNWKEKLQGEIDLLRQKAKAQQLKFEAEQKRKDEQREQLEYLRLKQKFES